MAFIKITIRSDAPLRDVVAPREPRAEVTKVVNPREAAQGKMAALNSGSSRNAFDLSGKYCENQFSDQASRSTWSTGCEGLGSRVTGTREKVAGETDGGRGRSVQELWRVVRPGTRTMNRPKTGEGRQQRRVRPSCLSDEGCMLGTTGVFGGRRVAWVYSTRPRSGAQVVHGAYFVVVP